MRRCWRSLARVAFGKPVAPAEIAPIKLAAPNKAGKAIDWAIRAPGGGGTSNDIGLADAYAMSRARRNCG